jgi:hypothetical protein
MRYRSSWVSRGCTLVDLVILITIVVLGLCALCSGCLHPLPPVPVPLPPSADASVTDSASADGPIVPDPFRDGIFDCRLPVVGAQYAAALPRVGDCLDAQPLGCLIRLTSTFAPDTVACLVRDLGFAANNAALAGTSPDGGIDRAALVRDFIESRDMGFR